MILTIISSLAGRLASPLAPSCSEVSLWTTFALYKYETELDAPKLEFTVSEISFFCGPRTSKNDPIIDNGNIIHSEHAVDWVEFTDVAFNANMDKENAFGTGVRKLVNFSLSE